MEVTGQLHSPPVLSQGKQTSYSLNTKLWGSPSLLRFRPAVGQSRSGRSGGKNKNSCPCRESNPGLVSFLKTTYYNRSKILRHSIKFRSRLYSLNLTTRSFMT